MFVDNVIIDFFYHCYDEFIIVVLLHCLVVIHHVFFFRLDLSYVHNRICHRILLLILFSMIFFHERTHVRYSCLITDHC